MRRFRPGLEGRLAAGTCIALLSIAGCSKNIAPLADLDGLLLVAPPVAADDLSAGPSRATTTDGGTTALSGSYAWTVSGTVTLAPELVDRVSPDSVLFVFARAPGDRVPAAVQRIAGPRFPVAFVLVAGHAGASGGGAANLLEVVARLSRRGMAGQPQEGDLEGRSDKLVAPGASGVLVTIDSVVSPQAKPRADTR